MSASLHFSNNNSDSYIRTDEELNMSNSNAMAFLSALGLDANFWDAPAKPIEELEQAIGEAKAKLVLDHFNTQTKNTHPKE